MLPEIAAAGHYASAPSRGNHVHRIVLLRPRISNCLIWAVYHQLKYGGRIAYTQSEQIRWLPHFIWSPDSYRWYSYAPIERKVRWWRIVFRGRVYRKLGCKVWASIDY